ncbi:MAG: acetate--CoA ligase [Alphaproteobacteria bacterium]|nr:acetate--CoA ligase [Alphaproteobacteria bacterium]
MFHIKTKLDYSQQYQASINDPKKFWGEIASEYFWFEKWSEVSNCDLEKAQIEWFKNGKTNIVYNCLDRHLEQHGDKVAIIWEGNDPAEKNQKITYKELHAQTCQFANLLIAKGVKKGDRVCIYMPMIPQAIVAMLACARIGAVHCVVFAGFSAKSLAGRIQDSGAKILITSDVLFRGDKKIELLAIAKEAAAECEALEEIIVFERESLVERSRNQGSRQARPTINWQEEVKKFPTTHNAEICDAEDPLFILYTSGSTGKPKGILHSTGGYMTYAGYSFKNVFQPQENDIFFCSADIGWITGHSYLVYGPLLNGATILMFEGVPTYPTPARFWGVIEKHKVNIFYTAPTAIRALMQKGDSFASGHDLSSLKTLGTVGEPINEEAWQWYFEKIGKKKCPIVDTWWQTETGGILISSMAGVFDSKPAHAGLPLPGIVPILLDDSGKEITEKNKVGNLCMCQAWPGMARGVWGDREKFVKTYYSPFLGNYFAGDGAFVSDDGLYRIIGRTDDVIKVSGHRLGTAEIENAINSHPQVSESAAIGVPHEIKGEAICVFAIAKKEKVSDTKVSDTLAAEISEIIIKEIGAIARPEKVFVVPDLPKTRSGKIMRRVLKKIVSGEKDLGDTSTLVNPDVVVELKRLTSAV